MINLYNDCQQTRYKPTEKEFELLLKSFKPGQKLPHLNSEDCHIQLVYETYLDILLEGRTLKFMTDRSPVRSGGAYYLGSYAGLILEFIVSEIIDAIEYRGLHLHFELDEEEDVLLHNYRPDYNKKCDLAYQDGKSTICIPADEFMKIGFKISGDKIECHYQT